MIQQLAALYISPTEIAITLDVDEMDLKEDLRTANHVARKAYLRGKLSQKIETRKQMAMLARVGSPTAIEMSERALMDMEDDEM